MDAGVEGGEISRVEAIPFETPIPEPEPAPAAMLVERERIALSWSGGKDSALALLAILADPTLEVAALLTTVREPDACVATHEVPQALVEAQAAALGIPMRVVSLPPRPSNAEYERRVGAAYRALQADGVERVAFGDLFLDDVRLFREAMLAPLGMRGLYPLWGEDTTAVAERAVAVGLRALVVSVDVSRLEPDLCGREYDGALLQDLPAHCDPCGERGEFHTFVYDGPAFAAPVAFTRGAPADRDGMRVLRLLPPA